MKLLEKMFSEPKFRSLLSNHLKESWMLRPEDVAAPGKVGEMYRRLDRQLRSLGSDRHGTAAVISPFLETFRQHIHMLSHKIYHIIVPQVKTCIHLTTFQGDVYIHARESKTGYRPGI